MLDAHASRIANDLDNKVPSTDEDSGFALPKGSLDFLREVVNRCGVHRIFEFGSGQSTRIPTLERRVQAIARGNSEIQYRLLTREHGLGLLQNQRPECHVVKSNRSIGEIMKTIRRYLSARRGV